MSALHENAAIPWNPRTRRGAVLPRCAPVRRESRAASGLARSSRIEAAKLGRFSHALDTKHIGCPPHTDAALLMDSQDLRKAGLHHALQPVVNILSFPEQVLLVLDPLEI